MLRAGKDAKVPSVARPTFSTPQLHIYQHHMKDVLGSSLLLAKPLRKVNAFLDHMDCDRIETNRLALWDMSGDYVPLYTTF